MNRGQNPETIRARFTASGFDTTTNTYANRDDLLLDASDTASDQGGRVFDYGDEVVATSSSGEEIARWEIL